MARDEVHIALASVRKIASSKDMQAAISRGVDSDITICSPLGRLHRLASQRQTRHKLAHEIQNSKSRISAYHNDMCKAIHGFSLKYEQSALVQLDLDGESFR